MTKLLTGEPGIENVFLPDEKLKIADRSDASPTAQAIVRVRHRQHGVLDFDKHHFERHEPALIAQGWEVVEDLRDTLK